MTRPSPLLIPVLPLLSALLLLAWWLPNRPRAGDVTMPADRFNSVSFAPFRASQSPLADRFPTAAQVEEDVALVAGRTRALRTYAAIEGDYDVAAMAERHGLKLWLGIWLGADRASNAREMARGIEIANRYPDTVERVVVGNEVLLRRDLPPAELMAAIGHVRASVKQKVTYADVWEFWAQYPDVARHVDIVTIHILPYWEDHPTNIDGAMDHVREVYHRMAALFPGQPIAIGETGWPSRGRWRQDAAPSRVNEAIFLRRFVALAQREGFDYNFVEAFDQQWKYRSEGTVGANWGLWTIGRAAKFPLDGPVVEDPSWPWWALLAICSGVALLAGTLALQPKLAARVQVRLSILAMVLGAAFGCAAQGTLPLLYDWHLRVAALVNLPGQFILAALLMHRAAQLLTGRGVPARRTAAQATKTVRALLLGRFARLGAWRTWLFDDLSFLFVWTAAVLQLLLLFDPRYRDFPLPTFAVPLAAVLARALLGDLPVGGGGAEEAWAGLTLALAALASGVLEGPANLQAVIWTLAALVLAAPTLLRCVSWRTAPARI